ncbi:hypothetical protein PO124_15555 [Bacillus licheniformis]|nr:hypothetical protein [Bacillus licheniformis]
MGFSGRQTTLSIRMKRQNMNGWRSKRNRCASVVGGTLPCNAWRQDLFF